MARPILIFIFFLVKTQFYAQFLCTLTSTPSTLFYPNTTTVPTPTSVVGNFYLCGPNTIVYDTMGYFDCQYAYLNPGSHLIIKTPCMAVQQVWLKNTATLTVLPQMQGPSSIVHEPGAVIINLTPNILTTYTCPLITFPYANCTTGIVEQKLNNDLFNISPNPANDKIKLDFYDKSFDVVELILYDSRGITVYADTNWQTSNQNLDISSIPSGYYFVEIKTKKSKRYSKLFVIH